MVSHPDRAGAWYCLQVLAIGATDGVVMTYTYWTLSLMPGEGWIVRRMVKRGTLFARCTVEYGRLTYSEAMDVLDSDCSDAILAELELG